VSTVGKNQNKARNDCLSFGGDLVSVEDDAEMDYIITISYVHRFRFSAYLVYKFAIAL